MKYVFFFFFFPPVTFSHRYFTHRHTWEDAEKDCREHSAHLSSVISVTEQEFINGMCVCVCFSQFGFILMNAMGTMPRGEATNYKNDKVVSVKMLEEDW